MSSASTARRPIRRLNTTPRGAMLTVDLARGVIGTAQQQCHFDFPEEQRQALLQGLDDIDRSRRLESRLATFQQADRAARPWVYAAG